MITAPACIKSGLPSGRGCHSFLGSRELLHENRAGGGLNPGVVAGAGAAPLCHWAWLPREGRLAEGTPYRSKLASRRTPTPQSSYACRSQLVLPRGAGRGRTLGRLERFPASRRAQAEAKRVWGVAQDVQPGRVSPRQITAKNHTDRTGTAFGDLHSGSAMEESGFADGCSALVIYRL